ncbi:hypothetical protein CJP46_26850 [Paenibacillus sp. XY044]|nr:hypothetical protein CJP46_26850 [Paenibacillus sp. XY044]
MGGYTAPGQHRDAAGASDSDQKAVNPIDVQEPFHGVRLLDRDGTLVQEWPLDSLTAYQPVWDDDEDPGPGMLVYSSDGRLPSNLQQNGSISVLPQPKWTPPKVDFANDFGQIVQYADRIVRHEIYAVHGHLELYRVNTQSGAAYKLYEFARPVYGVAASPDNSRVALLVASDDTLGPDADLIVLDRSGNKLLHRPRVSYLSHSDGLLFIYPLAWNDNETVTVPVDGYKEGRTRGVLHIRLDRMEASYEPDPSLPAVARRILAQHAHIANETDIAHFAAASGSPSSLYAVQLFNHDVWLVDILKGTAFKAGVGYPLHWTKDARLWLAANRPELPVYYNGW